MIPTCVPVNLDTCRLVNADGLHDWLTTQPAGRMFTDPAGKSLTAQSLAQDVLIDAMGRRVGEPDTAIGPDGTIYHLPSPPVVRADGTTDLRVMWVAAEVTEEVEPETEPEPTPAPTPKVEPPPPVGPDFDSDPPTLATQAATPTAYPPPITIEPTPGQWHPCAAYKGLEMMRVDTSVIFRHGEATLNLNMLTGEVRLGGHGRMPQAARHTILAKFAAVPVAAQVRAGLEKVAAEEAQAEVAQVTPAAFPQPITPQPVPLQEEPMPVDWSDPDAVAKARKISAAVKSSIGVDDLAARRVELAARRAELRWRDHDVETQYRRAEAQADEAKRNVALVERELKDRDAELVMEQLALTNEAGKKLHTSAASAEASATAARKTDEQYNALRAALKHAQDAQRQADLDLADRKADQRSLPREHEAILAESASLAAEHNLAAARVTVFAGLDAPDTPQAAPQAA